jgi:uncharacterized protein
LLLVLFACQSESRISSNQQRPLKSIELITPSGDVVRTRLAYDSKAQEQGLSGLKPEDFKDDEGMLFFYLADDERHFWMPDTYFDLDLFYLDKELKIIDVIRKLPFYVGRSHLDLVPRARGVWCRHTLEMKSTSSIAQRLKMGDTLKWKADISLEETESDIVKMLIK